MQRKEQAVHCIKCKFFYITWDKAFPYGCKAMKFKSKNMPFLEVRQIAGHACLDYKDKSQSE